MVVDIDVGVKRKGRREREGDRGGPRPRRNMMVATTYAKSPRAQQALQLLTEMQTRLTEQLSSLSTNPLDGFSPISWQRNHGAWGGGRRLTTHDDATLFNRASANFSQVQYEECPERKLASATALSTIIHPRHPTSPSLHLHVSYTEDKQGTGSWRLMVDLNPSHPRPAETACFAASLYAVNPKLYSLACQAGDRYFFIPALQRHRGSFHYYLEGQSCGKGDDDVALARTFTATAITSYRAILSESLPHAPEVHEHADTRQLEYHTLYFLQVLTLDRGTTVGLLAHADNDLGVMASLPRVIDRRYLEAWRSLHPPEQQALVAALLACLPHGSSGVTIIGDEVKLRLAQAVRNFYQHHPEALPLQAPCLF